MSGCSVLFYVHSHSLSDYTASVSMYTARVHILFKTRHSISHFNQSVEDKTLFIYSGNSYQNMTSKKLKLIYFDFRARAEVSRLLMAAGGQDYEDVRITESQWLQEKKKMPFGQVPVLQIGEKLFAQSVAIETYLARELGLHGKTNLESLMIDQVVQFNQEFRAKAITAIKELDSSKKADLLKNVKEVEVPRYFTHLEELLKQNGTGYFVGSSLTYADISTYDNIYAFSVRGPLLELPDDSFPLLKAQYNRVEKTDRIKEYLANRKKTEV